MTSRTPFLRLPAALLLGALVLASGLALARLWLPEWQGGAVPGEDQGENLQIETRLSGSPRVQSHQRQDAGEAHG